MTQQEAGRFAAACAAAADPGAPRAGIGMLGEKTLHRALKYYFAPDGGQHEIKIGPYVADIVGEDGIVEIQTRDFGKMREKLETFLSVARVTVVHPIEHTRRNLWVDPSSGEIAASSKSPVRGRLYHAMPELYRIKALLGHPNLTVRLMLIDVELYRLLDGRGKDRRRRSTKQDRVPLALRGEAVLACPDDYRIFLPEALPEEFTVSDFARAARLGKELARLSLHVLWNMGVVERLGRRGREYIYRLHAAGKQEDENAIP